MLKNRDKDFVIIKDYFSSQNIHKISKNIKKNDNNFKYILIERRVHMCAQNNNIYDEKDFINQVEEKSIVQHRSYAKNDHEDDYEYSKFISEIKNKCN